MPAYVLVVVACLMYFKISSSGVSLAKDIEIGSSSFLRMAWLFGFVSRIANSRRGPRRSRRSQPALHGFWRHSAHHATHAAAHAARRRPCHRPSSAHAAHHRPRRRRCLAARHRHRFGRLPAHAPPADRRLAPCVPPMRAVRPCRSMRSRWSMPSPAMHPQSDRPCVHHSRHALSDALRPTSSSSQPPRASL